jgi:hypothetical protein
MRQAAALNAYRRQEQQHAGIDALKRKSGHASASHGNYEYHDTTTHEASINRRMQYAIRQYASEALDHNAVL